MDDGTEFMRQQILDTRSQLTEKLVSLEQQVSDTVESTGSAVNATVGAVQDTVTSVTNAVRGAVHSVSETFNIQQQIKHHPWLTLGGSVALGYLVVDLLNQSANACGNTRKPAGTLPLAGNSVKPAGPDTAAGLAAATSAINGANEAASTTFLWHQLSTAVTGALVGIVQDAASHVVPQIMQYLNRTNTPVKEPATEEPAATVRPRNPVSTPERFVACRTNGR